MYRIYRHAQSCQPVSVLVWSGWGHLSARQRELELEMRIKNRGVRDPEGPPDPEPGDKYIVVGTLVGLVVGGVLGGFIGNLLTGFFGGVIGSIAGIIAGGIIGAKVGNSIKIRRKKDLPGEHEPKRPF